MVHIIPLSVARRRSGSAVQDPGPTPAGGASQQLDGYWREIAERHEQRTAQQQAFDTEIAARKLNGEIAKAEADAVANAPADGAGLHQGMYGEVDPHTGRVLQTGRFDSLFQGFLSQVQPELHPGLAARKEALRTEGSLRMAAQQLQRRKDYEKAAVDTTLATNAIAIGEADPDDLVTFEAARQQGLDLIDKMGVDPGIRQKIAKDWYSTAAKTRFEALIAKDPQRALEIFGVGMPATHGEVASHSAHAEGGFFGGGPRMAPGKEGGLGAQTPDERIVRAFSDDRGAPLDRLPADPLLADLSPDTARDLAREAYTANAARLIDARTDIALATRNAPDAIANTGVYSGKMPGPETFTAAYGVEEGGKQYGDFARQIDVGRQAFGMRTLPNQAIHAALRDAEPGPGRSTDEQARFEVAAAAAIKTLSLRRADPAGYVQEVFPNVGAAWSAATSPDSKPENGGAEAYKRAIAVSVAAQRQLGVENPQPLPRAVAEGLVQTLSNKDVTQAEGGGILHDLLAAAQDPADHNALSQQLDQAGLPWLAQVDPIVTAATGRPMSAPPGDARSAFQQVAEDLGDYLSESFEALGRIPHDIRLGLQDLRDSPWGFLEQLPVTPGSGLAAEGAAGLRWVGTSLLKGGKVADEVIEPILTAFSKNYRKTFFREYPELAGMVFVHHRVEQKVLKLYAGIISESMMHSLENLRGIPKALNSTLHLSIIRREWDAFYRQNRTTTLKKLLDKAAEIDQKYGHLFNPPVGKK